MGYQTQLTVTIQNLLKIPNPSLSLPFHPGHSDENQTKSQKTHENKIWICFIVFGLFSVLLFLKSELERERLGVYVIHFFMLEIQIYHIFVIYHVVCTSKFIMFFDQGTQIFHFSYAN